MKRERPPIPPLAVRVIVAERQFRETHMEWEWHLYDATIETCNLTQRLKWLLSRIFEDGENVVPHACDHDPALILRHYHPHAKDVAARYSPHAHNPDFLVYRSKQDHQRKTTGRKPGASRTVTVKGSDVGLAAKFRRLEREKPKPKAKFAISQKPWPKQKMRKQLRDRP